MPGASSLPPDLPPWRDRDLPVLRMAISEVWTRELETGILPTHTSHPFSCSFQPGVCSSQSSHPFSCSYDLFREQIKLRPSLPSWRRSWLFRRDFEAQLVRNLPSELGLG